MELLEEKINKLVEYIKKSQCIVFFGGAGCSTESGIPDFRSAKGIFTNDYSAEQIVSHEYFYRNPEGFYKFYKDKMMFLSALPNKCHLFLAELQKDKDIRIVTQNIDGLHQIAGSKEVYELHGSIHRNHCLKCGASFSSQYVYDYKGVPYCDKCGGMIKPDVVLYGEQLDYDVVNKARLAIINADLLIVGGTSLNVYPAASYIQDFHGNMVAVINLDNVFLENGISIGAPIGEVFAKVSDILYKK